MVAQYCKKVEAALKGNRSYRKNIVRNLEADLQEYLTEHPDATELDIQAHFGMPEDYAREYDATMVAGEKEERRKLRRHMLMTVAAAVVVALLMWAGVVISASMEATNNINGYATTAINGVNGK